MNRRLLLLPGLIALVLVGIFLGIRSLRPPGAVHLDQPAPDIELPILRSEGETLSLSSLRGNVVLLDFFATWCPPCREELPILVKLQERYRDQGLTVIAIDAIEREQGGIQQVERFVERFKMDFPVLLDEGEEAAALYRVEAIPTLFLIDREGIVRAVYQGVQSEQELTTAIEAFLH